MISRRRFLTALAAAPVMAAAHPLYASAFGAAPEGAAYSGTGMAYSGIRELRFLHTHTGEKLAIEYFGTGGYIPGALDEINHFLRDFRTGDQHVIDPPLLDLLHRLNTTTESLKPFEVISGYRSPITNASLRQHSEGVAAHSLHMEGKAIDIRLTDIPLAKLRAAALSMKAGGVGYYPASNFVHVDTGRVRYW